MRSYLNEPVMVTAIEPTVMHRQALLHRPNDSALFGQPQPVTVPVEDELVGGRGLFYRPRQWPLFSKPQGVETSLSENENEDVVNSRGLFYQPRGWMQSDSSESTFAEPQTRSEKLAANWGLFYRRGEWSMFGRPRESEASHTHHQSEIGTVEIKRGLLHRAQGWLGSDKPSTIGKNVRQLGRLQPATVLA